MNWLLHDCVDMTERRNKRETVVVVVVVVVVVAAVSLQLDKPP